MNIALLHYHTKKGGVTTVISQQISILKDIHSCMLITGDTAGYEPGIDVSVIPEVGYSDHNGAVNGNAVISPKETAEKIVKAIRGKWPDGDCILHVHNPLLKKNVKFLQIISELRKAPLSLFFQIHDFAEEGRPQVYYYSEDYPSNIHYGVINSRDHAVLLKAGLCGDGLHLLPNMVTNLPATAPKPEKEKDYILYPVRAIRRKNIGEILLLSLFVPKGKKIVVTLPPASRQSNPYFFEWKKTAESLELPVILGLNGKHDFAETLGRTCLALTTSIKEGFGFTFLEPWTTGIEVRGRYIDAVCPDFEKAGLDMARFYRAIKIPNEFFDAAEFKARWNTALDRWAKPYNRIFSEKEREAGFSLITDGGKTDFAHLDEKAQTEVIQSAARDMGVLKKLITANPWLYSYLRMPSDPGMISKNSQVIERTFGIEAYRESLLKLYEKVRVPVEHRVDKEILLEEFLKIENFSFLGLAYV
ncbi:MAG: hypothetical protein JW969_04950 [Spirochaetales bacterium]|nr:hypothetical protein [Spirochaetales bacterium]